MRPWCLVLALGLAVVLGCGGNVPNPAASEPEPELRSVRLPSVVVTGPAIVAHDFVVRNALDRPVHFSGVHATCGCTSARLTRQDLLPGEQATLHVELNLQGRRGRQLVECALHEPDGPPWRYQIETEAWPAFEFTPAQVLLGTMDVGDRRAAAVSRLVLRARVPELLPEVVRTDVPAALRASWGEPLVSSVQQFVEESRELRLTLAGGTASPQPGTAARVVLRQQGTEHQLVLPVHWQIRSVYVAAPARVVFRGAPETPARVRVDLAHREGAAFAIRGVQRSTDWFDAQVVTGPGPRRQHACEITVVGPEPARHAVGELRLVLEDEREPELRIPVAWLP